MSVEQRPVLLVEDEALTARITARAIEPRCPVVIASCIDEALRLLHEGLEPAGAILDYRLPKGVGLDLVEPLRARFAGIPIALLSGTADHAAIHQAVVMEVTYLPKPYDSESLEAFLDQVERYALLRAATSAARRIADELVGASGLTKRHLELLRLRWNGLSVKEAARAMGISLNTVKSHTREILTRTGAKSLEELALRVVLKARE